MKTLSIVTTISGFMFLTSCDRIDNPLPPKINCDNIKTFSDTTYSATNTTKRVLVIEEFTGHKCPNCPVGSKELQKLDSSNGIQIIPVSIHAGSFAEPDPNNADGSFATDFRSAEGNAYHDGFNAFFYPSGMVSRIIVGTGAIKGHTEWAAIVSNHINDPCPLQIDIINYYNNTVKILKTSVSTNWLTGVAGIFKLQVLLTEDSIMDWQLNGTQKIKDYLHRHVLRKSLNTTWGTDIPSSGAGDKNQQEFCFDFSKKTWKPDHCAVVAFVYRNTPPDYEIIQAAEAEVK